MIFRDILNLLKKKMRMLKLDVKIYKRFNSKQRVAINYLYSNGYNISSDKTTLRPAGQMLPSS